MTDLPVKIIWPDSTGVEERGWKHRNQVMLSGFESLGIPFVYSDEFRQDRFTKYSAMGVRGALYFDIVFREGVQRVWWDYGDNKRCHMLRVDTGKEIYFKLALTRTTAKIPRVYPIGLTDRTHHFFDRVKELREIRKKNDRCGTHQYDMLAFFRCTELTDRANVIRYLRGKEQFEILSGMADCGLRLAPDDIRVKKLLPFHEFLRVLASCRFALAMPGTAQNQDYRFAEGMGLGLCTLAPDNYPIMPEQGSLPVVQFKQDLSNLAEIIDYYKKHKRERFEIAESGQHYYEDFLSPVGRAKYILRIVEKERRL